jgi:hypothetical protein
MSEAESLDRLIRESVAAVRFGTVTLTIHDARVVQIERTEKIRLPEPKR